MERNQLKTMTMVTDWLRRRYRQQIRTLIAAADIVLVNILDPMITKKKNPMDKDGTSQRNLLTETPQLHNELRCLSLSNNPVLD